MSDATLLQRIKEQTGLHGEYEHNGLEYSFTSSETASGKHIAFVESLELLGVQSLTKIKAGKGRLKGFTYAKVLVPSQPTISRAELVADRILSRFAIGANVTEHPHGMEIGVQNIYSAQTLLRAFSRHHIQVAALDGKHFQLFVPVRPELLLTA